MKNPEASGKESRSETESLLHQALVSIPETGPTAESEELLQKAIDTLLPVSYQQELAHEGIVIGTHLSLQKIEIMVREGSDNGKDDAIRVFIKYRKNGLPRLQITKGWGEWPVREYPLPLSVSRAQKKLKEVIEEVLRHP